LYDSVKKWVRCDELMYSVDGLPVQRKEMNKIPTKEERPQKKHKADIEQTSKQKVPRIHNADQMDQDVLEIVCKTIFSILSNSIGNPH
jgi:hypothetical protein